MEHDCLLVCCGPEVSVEPQHQQLGRKAGHEKGKTRTNWNPQWQNEALISLATSNLDNTEDLPKQLALFSMELCTHLA